jgi:trigger factor
MDIQVTELDYCKLKVAYRADAEQISNKREEILDIFKKAPVPGFRPGKASKDAIRLHYREQIDESLKRALAEEAFHNTLFEKNIKPHGPPQLNSLFLGDGKFNCEFEMYTRPNFELFDLKLLEVPKPHESEDATVVCERMLQELRHRFGEVQSFKEEDFVQKGDKLSISYECTVDEQKMDNLCAENEDLVVGNGQLSDFDDNLLGMKIGETREFNLAAPETSLPSLVGKTLKFKVTVNSGSKTVPCALDDAFANKLGKSSYNELREFVLGSAQSQLQNKFKTALNSAVSKKLVDAHNIRVPQWMTLSEARYLVHSSKVNWDTLPDVDKEKYINIAEQNVKLALILDKLRENHPDAQLTDQEVFEIIKRTLSNNNANVSLESILTDLSKTGYLQVLISRIRDEHTLDFVVNNTKIIE